MSPLDDRDLDRISDKVKLAIREAIDDAMHQHLKEAHAALEERFDKMASKLDLLNTKVLTASGVFAAIIWALQNWAK